MELLLSTLLFLSWLAYLQVYLQLKREKRKFRNRSVVKIYYVAQTKQPYVKEEYEDTTRKINRTSAGG
jgi:hypothetical protein